MSSKSKESPNSAKASGDASQAFASQFGSLGPDLMKIPVRTSSSPRNMDEQKRAQIHLFGVISQMFDKALMEPTFCEMFADLCLHLCGAFPDFDFNENGERITFKRFLISKCQEEFERGAEEVEEASRVAEEEETDEEREEKRLEVRRRLGNIRLIGELYKRKILTEKIMHSCIQKLLGYDQDPHEEKLFEQVKSVEIDNDGTLSGVISQMFDKALMEPTFCEMYADFCLHLSRALPDFNENGEKITFKRLLINKCQEEFERGEKYEEEASRVAGEGQVEQTEEEREEKRLKVRRRLGNIRLAGELYKRKILTEKIMHSCIQKLLGYDRDPHEDDIEALCTLMSTIGVAIDHKKAKNHMDAYFKKMKMLSCKQELSSRVRFMLTSITNLRKNKWQE